MENFILIFICLVFGVVMQRREVFAENAPLTLNLYVIWVALPGLILYQVPKLSYQQTFLFCSGYPGLWPPWGYFWH